MLGDAVKHPGESLTVCNGNQLVCVSGRCRRILCIYAFLVVFRGVLGVTLGLCGCILRILRRFVPSLAVSHQYSSRLVFLLCSGQVVLSVLLTLFGECSSNIFALSRVLLSHCAQEVFVKAALYSFGTGSFCNFVKRLRSARELFGMMYLCQCILLCAQYVEMTCDDITFCADYSRHSAVFIMQLFHDLHVVLLYIVYRHTELLYLLGETNKTLQ